MAGSVMPETLVLIIVLGIVFAIWKIVARLIEIRERQRAQDTRTIPLVHKAPEYRSITILVYTIIITPLLLPTLLGIVIRISLQAKELPVVSWLEGAGLVLVLTLWFIIPFLILSYATKRVLLKLSEKHSPVFSKWFHIFVGAFLGVTLAAADQLLSVLQAQGPGGLPNAVGLMVALWVIVVLDLVLFSALAGLFGAALGWIIWFAREKLGKKER